MSLVISQRLRMVWILVALLGGLQRHARAQAKFPLPPPGAEHPALFLRLMTRLCGELEKAAAAGALNTFVPGEALLKEGKLELLASSEVKMRQEHDGSWVLAGPLAVGTRIDPFELRAESRSCSTENRSSLHEDVQWASCQIRASQSARCQLELRIAHSTRLRKIEQGPESFLPWRSFALTFNPAPRTPQRPVLTPPAKKPSL